MKPTTFFLFLGFVDALLALVLGLLGYTGGAIAFGLISGACFLSAALLGRQPPA